MNTDKNNKLIAEFMGWKNIPRTTFYTAGTFKHKYNGFRGMVQSSFDDTYIGAYERDFLFHESWEWLMPVIEKIETINKKNELQLQPILLHWMRNNYTIFDIKLHEARY